MVQKVYGHGVFYVSTPSFWLSTRGVARTGSTRLKLIVDAWGSPYGVGSSKVNRRHMEASVAAPLGVDSC